LDWLLGDVVFFFLIVFSIGHVWVSSVVDLPLFCLWGVGMAGVDCGKRTLDVGSL